MSILWWAAGILAVLIALQLLVAYICFRMAFYISDGEKDKNRKALLPPGKIYKPYHGVMSTWQREVRQFPSKEIWIRSFDGLKLRGKFYEAAPGAVIELMFHGYRGTAERDLCGGVQRAFALGHSVLMVDQRASGLSEGNVITFGIRESRDCDAWIAYAIRQFGPDVRLILTGISMGAATVLMAAGKKLPEQVIGVLADCGYSSARDIIQKEIRRMGLPAQVLYPFVRLGAELFGSFDPDSDSPAEAAKRCRLPVIFFHGDADDFVPCKMSKKVYTNCSGKKRLCIIPGAGHGLCYPADPDGYLQALREFFP